MATRSVATVFGGSGFIGRYVVKRLAQAGHVVRVAGRDTERARQLCPMGAVGQIVPLFTSFAERGTVERAVAEALGRVVGEDPWSRGAPGAPWGPSAQALQKPSGAAAGAPSPRKRGR